MEVRTKVIRYYSNISETYERVRLGTVRAEIVSESQIDWFIENLESTGRVCLEIGCGTGRITRALAGRTKFLVATDASLEMIRVNRNIAAADAQTQYVLCDASHLPFLDKSCDSVIGARLFWHLKTYRKALREAFRVVEDECPLLFDFPSLLGPFALHSKLRRVKHEVLTLFIDRKTVRQIFSKASIVVIRGNASVFLFLLPTRLLMVSAIRKALCLFEQFNYIFFKDWLYSYYLIRVTK